MDKLLTIPNLNRFKLKVLTAFGLQDTNGYYTAPEGIGSADNVKNALDELYTMHVVRYFNTQVELQASINKGIINSGDISFVKENKTVYTNGVTYGDLSAYLKTADADKKYLKQSASGAAVINVDSRGALANVSDNGQAYLAVRASTPKFIINTPYSGAAFGVKDDGTAAFSHKTYTDYKAEDGSYKNARNTAVLQFAGPTGLRYAKNTGGGNDVTDAMYRYVGVIDSPDEFQRVYSAKQVDDLLNPLKEQIEALQAEIEALKG